MPPDTFENADRLKLLEGMIARLKRHIIQLETVSNKYWTVRRVVVACGIVLGLVSCNYAGSAASWVSGAAFVVIFLVVARYHKRVLDSITRHALMLEIKQVQVARIHLDWDRLPPVDLFPTTAGHPFETDLDITGERSLHRLLDSAVTKEGSDRLKSWLLNEVPDPVVIKKRQSLVKELKGHSIFRDKLQLLSAVASSDAYEQRYTGAQRARWNSRVVVDWIQHEVRKDSLFPTVRLLCVLAALNLTLIVLAGFNLIPHVWPIAFLAYVGVMIAKQSQVGTAWGELQDLEKALRRFKAVFEYLESRGYNGCPGLIQICAPFLDKKKTALRRDEKACAARVGSGP